MQPAGSLSPSTRVLSPLGPSYAAAPFGEHLSAAQQSPALHPVASVDSLHLTQCYSQAAAGQGGLKLK